MGILQLTSPLPRWRPHRSMTYVGSRLVGAVHIHAIIFSGGVCGLLATADDYEWSLFMNHYLQQVSPTQSHTHCLCTRLDFHYVLIHLYRIITIPRGTILYQMQLTLEFSYSSGGFGNCSSSPHQHHHHHPCTGPGFASV